MIAKSRLQLALLLSSLLGVTAFVSSACGGISDPTKGGDGRVATVSGALTGITVPANARVALVYRKIVTVGTSTTTTVQVGSDVPVVGGKFTMNIGIPADDLFGTVDSSSITSVSSSPPSVRKPSPTTAETPPSAGTSTSGSPGAFGERLAPRDLVGGSITEPLTAALAGFVVYADTNGNGQLDLEGQYASSPDQILGGNKELILVYLKGGGSLDYEKMRDKSGILPTAGFDLAWTEGRWLPLTDVELKLAANAQLPSAVCQTSSSGVDTVSASPDPTISSGGGSAGAGGSSGTGGSGGVSTTSDGGSGGTYYPSPSDPQLKCSADGRSYTYGDSPTTCTTPPAPTGLCAGDVYSTTYCAGSTGYGNALPPGAPVPDGWPCPTTPDFDGGGAPDGSTDGGSVDGGSADGG